MAGNALEPIGGLIDMLRNKKGAGESRSIKLRLELTIDGSVPKARAGLIRLYSLLIGGDVFFSADVDQVEVLENEFEKNEDWEVGVGRMTDKDK